MEILSSDSFHFFVAEHPLVQFLLHPVQEIGAAFVLPAFDVDIEAVEMCIRDRVYSVTDDKGNKVGSPFKSSLFGKSAGYEAVQKKFARSKQEIKDRKLADMTKRCV